MQSWYKQDATDAMLLERGARAQRTSVEAYTFCRGFLLGDHGSITRKHNIDRMLYNMLCGT